MEEKINLMKKRFKHEGFTFTEKQKLQFYSFYKKKKKKNKVMNLTSITEFDEVSYSIYNRSQHALRFKKKINGITYITVAVISNKYQTFRIQTVYIDKDDFLKIYSKNTK